LESKDTLILSAINPKSRMLIRMEHPKLQKKTVIAGRISKWKKRNLNPKSTKI
jgi:hypothetical protein